MHTYLHHLHVYIRNTWKQLKYFINTLFYKHELDAEHLSKSEMANYKRVCDYT